LKQFPKFQIKAGENQARIRNLRIQNMCQKSFTWLQSLPSHIPIPMAGGCLNGLSWHLSLQGQGTFLEIRDAIIPVDQRKKPSLTFHEVLVV